MRDTAYRSIATLTVVLANAACGTSGTSTDAASDIVAPDHADAATNTDVTVPTDVSQSDATAMDAIVDAPMGRNFSTNRTDFGLGGTTRCASAGVQLCEDFETGTLDTATWHVNGTAPVIDGTHTARGSHALHITKHGNGGSYIVETRTFPAMNNTYWGRMFVYFQSLPLPAMNYAHWTFAAASGTGIPAEIRLSGQLSSGNNLFGVGTDSAGHTGDWTNSDRDPAGNPRPVPTGEWMCIEWMHAGATNETSFYWDGVEHPSLHTTATMHGTGSGAADGGSDYILPQFTQVWIGWDEYQTSTETFEMWVDEIAIDRARIGCVL